VVSEENMECDVAVIGGGPAGATVGTLLRKYSPDLNVVILERERFPRDHVGESLLPIVPRILNEMGAWDKVEAAGFPIKLGAVYRWGRMDDTELYYFHFLENGKFDLQARPASYSGQRQLTTFQVDRAIYDKILLDHSREMGCKVLEGTRVSEVHATGDRIDYVVAEVSDGSSPNAERVTAKHYVDASGGESVLRRAMNVQVQSPTLLRNIAMWDYWLGAGRAEERGIGGTFVYVLSIGWGWLWFIPIGSDRTSVGLVTSADYYKRSGRTTEELYVQATSEQPLVQRLLSCARREDNLRATKDWSFVADRLYGENWFLAGDAAGFADPILAAGLTLAQSGARRVACSILEMERGEVDPAWIKSQYQLLQKKNTLNHIRFADYWYSANAQFTDLKEYCSEIAKDSGLTLEADAAFQWLGTGGFTDETDGTAYSGTYTLTAIKQFTSRFSGQETSWAVYDNNIFQLNADDVVEEQRAVYNGGRVLQTPCLRRGDRTLPLHMFYKVVYEALRKECEIQFLAERFIFEAQRQGLVISTEVARACLETLEALVTEGWVTASYDPTKPPLDVGRGGG
jgi:flavin-dependent dehydrogenase